MGRSLEPPLDRVGSHLLPFSRNLRTPTGNTRSQGQKRRRFGGVCVATVTPAWRGGISRCSPPAAASLRHVGLRQCTKNPPVLGRVRSVLYSFAAALPSQNRMTLN